jgi:hypothetical protein
MTGNSNSKKREYSSEEANKMKEILMNSRDNIKLRRKSYQESLKSSKKN